MATLARCGGADSRTRPGTLRCVEPPLTETGYSYGRLHHVQVAMPRGEDETARAFYGEALGMVEVRKPPVLAERGGLWFRTGGVELHVGVEDDFWPARKAHPAFAVNALEALAQRLGERGVEIRWDGNFPGYRRFYAHDPFDNRLEFLEPEAQI
jgi:catechol 2,3-dioxygenase-like lactoylglutathione lyase family enzyme